MAGLCAPCSAWVASQVCQGEKEVMGNISVDTSQLPVVIVDIEGSYSEEQAIAFTRDMRSVLERRQRIAVVTDASDAAMTSLKTRSILKQFVGDSMHLSDICTTSAAVVVKSNLIRMAVSAMFHLKKKKFPLKVFNSRAEAIDWAHHQMELDSGMAAPDAKPPEGEELFCGDAE